MLITLFLFIKGTATGEVERLVAQAQCAAALDTLVHLRGIPAVERMIVSTADGEFATQARALGAQVELDPPGQPFHFGERLAALVERYAATTPLYVGGGSGALMRPVDWGNLVDQIGHHPGAVVTNNLFSCDFAAWSPGAAVARIAPPMLDNDLAYRLKTQAGLAVIALAKNASTQLDIDTPTDLMTISQHPAVGPSLRTFIDHAPLDQAPVARIKALVHDPRARLIVAGRVSASMALFLERETPAQWRIYSEERGMRASGRDLREEVRSLLGMLLDRVGPNEFFADLARMADGALIDSRVLFAHNGRQPLAADRFNSDLLRPEAIADPWVRSFTQAACAASLPVLLGGHSLVSGGMYALAEK